MTEIERLYLEFELDTRKREFRAAGKHLLVALGVCLAGYGMVWLLFAGTK